MRSTCLVGLILLGLCSVLFFLGCQNACEKAYAHSVACWTAYCETNEDIRCEAMLRDIAANPDMSTCPDFASSRAQETLDKTCEEITAQND